MILYHHHHTSFAEEYMVQRDNAIAYFKFFSACFLQTPLLVQRVKDYQPRLHHHYYHLAPLRAHWRWRRLGLGSSHQKVE
jgi:hypothetical protein